MSFIDHAKGEINFKIVYWGPGLGGKTTNLQYIYSRTRPEAKGKMISLATDTERSLFFDFKPLSIPPVGGCHPRFWLYTVPGPVFYDVSRRLILQGVDGVVFVADSQRCRAEANVESLEHLDSGLASHGYAVRNVPLVMQYNKRDTTDAMPVPELDALLDGVTCPRIEAVAPRGDGVFDTLKEIARRVLSPHRAS